MSESIINPYRFVELESEWTPNVSGTLSMDGLAVATTSHKTLKIIIETGNPIIGSTLVKLTLTWQRQNSPAVAGTWQVKHYLADDTLKSTGSTTATPPGSASATDFTADGTTNISAGDYITWSCLEAEDTGRDPVFATYASSTDSSKYTSTVLNNGHSVDFVKLIMTFS